MKIIPGLLFVFALSILVYSSQKEPMPLTTTTALEIPPKTNYSPEQCLLMAEMTRATLQLKYDGMFLPQVKELIDKSKGTLGGKNIAHAIANYVFEKPYMDSGKDRSNQIMRLPQEIYNNCILGG